MQHKEIYNDFERLSKEKRDELSKLETAHIDDILGRNRAASSKFRPVKEDTEKIMAGNAFTVKTSAGDNLYIYAAFDYVKEGDILVVDAEGYNDRAVMGEILIRFCEAKKLGGVVVNGAIRDSAALRELDIPVYATGYNPNGPYKNGPGALNVPVSLDTLAVEPGDVIIGDADGLIVIKNEEVDHAIEETHRLIKKEEDIIANYEKGIFPDTSFAHEIINNKE